MALVVLFALIIYVVVSIAIIILVTTHTKSKVCGFLAAIFFLLLPTWDVLLGKAVYTVACRYVPKVAIYKTVETEGIYYEGMNDDIFQSEPRGREPLSERVQVGLISDALIRGHAYAEAKITKKRPYATTDYFLHIPTVYYRCTMLPMDPTRPDFVRTDCRVVEHPQSRYVVYASTSQICTTSFNSKIIKDRTTGKFLGEYKEVVNEKVFPFFSWSFKGDGSPPTVRCPFDKGGGTANGRYLNFEFEVLKPKK